jgi:hypothetical protein
MTKLWNFAARAIAVTYIFTMTGAPVAAEGFKLTCAKTDFAIEKWKSPSIFVYEGEADKGQVKITGPLGDLTVPVSVGSSKPGDILQQRTFDGAAISVAQVPGLADFESCIKTARARDATSFQDALLDCLQALHPATEGVKVVTSLRIGIFTDADAKGGDDAYVSLRFKYEGSREVPGEEMVFALTPDACALAK